MKSPTSPQRMMVRMRFDALEKVGDDPLGGDKLDWVPQFYHWAEIKENDGSEEVIAQRLQGVVPVRIVLRSDQMTRQILSSWRAVEVISTRGIPPGGHDGDNQVEYTVTEICTYALKSSARDKERDRRFFTLQAMAGGSDA